VGRSKLPTWSARKGGTFLGMALLYNADDIMTAPGIRRPSVAGKLLIVAGIALLFCWAYYFLNLVRPVDVWDFCPIPFALTALLIGIKRTRLRWRVFAMIGVSYKRALCISIFIGALVEFGLWTFLFFEVRDPDTAERYLQQERLQEPGMRIGEAVYKYSYPHLGRTWALWIAGPCFFLVLIAIWSAGVFALLCIVRSIRNAASRVR
jgi:hypothetical protein